MHIWSRYPPTFGGDETFVVHRVSWVMRGVVLGSLQSFFRCAPPRGGRGWLLESATRVSDKDIFIKMTRVSFIDDSGLVYRYFQIYIPKCVELSRTRVGCREVANGSKNRPHDAYPVRCRVPGYYKPCSERVRVCQLKKCRRLAWGAGRCGGRWMWGWL